MMGTIHETRGLSKADIEVVHGFDGVDERVAGESAPCFLESVGHHHGIHKAFEAHEAGLRAGHVLGQRVAIQLYRWKFGAIVWRNYLRNDRSFCIFAGGVDECLCSHKRYCQEDRLPTLAMRQLYDLRGRRVGTRQDYRLWLGGMNVGNSLIDIQSISHEFAEPDRGAAMRGKRRFHAFQHNVAEG